MTRRTALFLLLMLATIVPTGAQAPATAAADNPLLKEWTTPFKVPPFSEIKPEHFLPAVKEAIAQNRKEIDAIANNAQPATFANTIEALENSGELLSKVQGVVRCPDGGRDQPATAGGQPGCHAARVRAARRGAAQREALSAHQGGLRRSGEGEPDADPGQAGRRGLQGLRARGRQPRSGEEGAAEEDQRRAVDADAEVRRQPAARHERVQTGHRPAGGPEGAAAVGGGGRCRGGEGGEHARQVGLHAPGAEHLAVPAVRRQP